MKKILLSVVAMGAVAVSLVGLSAFEAHVINVTAKIENALSVSTDSIDFGTVFPQEHLNKPLNVQLSGSFLTEDRVDDVEYFIRQKPKCGWTLNNGELLLGLPTATGHLVVDQATGGVTVECPDPGNPLRPDGSVYGVLPSLCQYISKEGNDPDGLSDENDGTTPSFHQPWVVVQGDNTDTQTVETYYIDYTDTTGYLSKLAQDISDDWTIDLAVPCFGGFCAQDWADFVASTNPEAGDPSQYTQPIGNEHKVFGCDLWVEVAGVSEAQEGTGGPG